MAKSKPKRLLMLALLLLTTAAAWAAATKQFPLYSGDEGTAAKPYQIKTVEDLIKLSDDVNSGTTYSGEYFKVMNNIDFNDAVDASLRPTTTWDDATSTESNFSGIGYYSHSFYGHFDGGGKTIKGIRIYDVEASSSHERKGFFGFIKDGAEVKNVTLDDTRITAYSSCGGIVGYISHSTVTGCTVTDHVAIHTVTDNSQYHGGIVGYSNAGTISNCTSSATLTIVDGLTGCYYYGGIVGYCYNSSTVSDNLALSAIVPQSGNSCGAILGYYQNSTLAGNYYHNCTVAGIVNAVDAAFLGQDNEGARSIHMLTLNNGVTTTTAPSVTIGNDNYYFKGITITINRTQPATYMGYMNCYTMNGSVFEGSTFDMPGYDVTVSSTTQPIYKLTLADGITTTTTPAITYGDDNYYLGGMTINLSGGLPVVSASTEFPYYTVNGKKISGDSFIMPATPATVATDKIVYDEWTGGEGTESSPYLIHNCNDLMLLAWRVNTGVNDTDGIRYGDVEKWYKLVADLQFDYAGLSDTESNFEAIGKNQNLCGFSAHFLGNGHTISGIRIRQGNNDSQGLFGYSSHAFISGIILNDADITGKSYTGGIVGEIYNYCTVTDCHVTSTVFIRATANKSSYHGGIVGSNSGSSVVSGCTSSATLTIENGATYCTSYGGIVGVNNQSTMSDNFAFGVRFPDNYDFGAIAGSNELFGTLLRNYYIGCTKEDNQTVKGCNGKDIFDNDGAVPGIALYNNTVYSGLNSHILQEAETGQRRVALLGRTLYKDDDWNTLCLPFDIGNFEGTILEGATVKELDSSTSSLDDNGVLTLYFNTVTSILADKPYIVKWESGSDIENPVFENVETNSSASTVVDFNGGSFVGTYNPFEITDANRNDILLLAAGNKLGYAKTDRTIANGKALGACRAYFHIPANGGSPAVRQYELDFGEETTGIEPLTFSPEGESTEASPRGGLVGASCYDLQGRRVLPLKKGIYIVNGRKVVIK